jgi:hypothetical protein
VSEKRVREVQFWALGFSRNRRKGYAVENLAGGLKPETVRFRLLVAREVKMEIPAYRDLALLCIIRASASGIQTTRGFSKCETIR